ncbi:uncharacterized protein BXZ73DRAFT_57398 [Epithele typhae]|uniref:uncharacterized protein n=1 Tax=Epithele typhae TaxID=378194 RepID=UPI002007475A|nr:uncharacterized protein BXZ73DRAFT_57398 [Epithele typhae]KAH9911021.1 hypothetical protein BXZ73DRAFT_57398 [Epithele typhae]
MGIYFPWRHLGLVSPLPPQIPPSHSFATESLTICSAIHRLPRWRAAGRSIRRLAILTDSANSVSMFTTLSASPDMNPILTSAVDILLACKCSYRIDHIPGEHNPVADALSRGQLARAYALDPHLDIVTFTPPRDALGGFRS